MTRASRSYGYLLAAAVLCIDFASKRYVLAHRGEFLDGIPLIDGILSFTYVRNSGAAFGMFQGGRWPFIVVSCIAAIALAAALWRARGPRLRRGAYALILAGAVGNLIDRLFYDGRVVDFILMSWNGHNFPVYNVADMGVSIGAALLIWTMLREPRELIQVEEADGAAEAEARVDP
jgi:signal peptidase II